MSYSISFEPAGVYAHFSGAITYKEIVDATEAIWSSAEFETLRYEIFDYSDVTAIDVSSYDAVEIAVRDRVASRNSNRNKIAIVATLPEIIEQTKTYRDTIRDTDVEILVTDTLEDARRWLAQ